MLICKLKSRDCKERNKSGDGMMLFVKENIFGKVINSHRFLVGTETIFFKFSICNKKITSSWHIKLPFLML